MKKLLLLSMLCLLTTGALAQTPTETLSTAVTNAAAASNVNGTDVVYDVQTTGQPGVKASVTQLATYFFGQVGGDCSATSGGSFTCTAAPIAIGTSTLLGNFSGVSQAASAQTVPNCASDGAHALTNPSGSGLNCNAISGAVSNGLTWLSPLSYNGAGVIETTNGTINSSSTSLSVGSISGWMNGAGIWVMGAGSAGADLVTTINGVPSGNTITLSGSASTGVTNAVVGPTGACNSSSNPTHLTVSNPNGFAQGQGIAINGAGSAGATLITSISSIAGSVFTLANACSTTVTTAIVNHDDTAAISAAITAALAAGVPVYIPAGNYNITSALTNVSSPLTIFGDGRFLTNIWNRAVSDTVLSIAYGTSNSGQDGSSALVTNFSVSQAPDVTPTGGGVFSVGGGGNFTNGLIISNIQTNNMYNTISVGNLQISNVFQNIYIQNQTKPLGWGILYNSQGPSGDDWFDNITLLNAGIQITKADTNSWSNIKITGGTGGATSGTGSGVVFNAASASDVDNQRFMNLDVENTTVCGIDFGSNGITSGTFVGGGESNICNAPTTFNAQVLFVGRITDNFTSVGGSSANNYISANGDQTSNSLTGKAFDVFQQGDPGASVSVFGASAPGTTAVNHFILGAWSGSGHNLQLGVDAGGNTYENGTAYPWSDASASTVGKIQMINASTGQIEDASTSNADGSIGILVNTSSFPLGPKGFTDAVVDHGNAACTFDNTAVNGDYVGYSSTTGGDCHDSGVSSNGGTRPTHGIGIAVESGTGSHLVFVRPW